MMTVQMESMVNGKNVEMLNKQNAKGTSPKSKMSQTYPIQSGSAFILGQREPMELIIQQMNVIKLLKTLVNTYSLELVLQNYMN